MTDTNKEQLTNTIVKDHTNIYVFRDGEEIEVTAPARFDAKTNELLYDGKLDDEAATKAIKLYCQKHHLVFGPDLVAKREAYGVSRKAMAKAIGISELTYELIELGEVPTKEHSDRIKSAMAGMELMAKKVKKLENNLAKAG